MGRRTQSWEDSAISIPHCLREFQITRYRQKAYTRALTKVRAETSALIVQHDDKECQFARVLPTHLNTTESTEVEALSPEAREQYYENSKTAAIAL